MKQSFLVLIAIFSMMACSSDDDSNNSSLKNVEIVLTEGSASYMKVHPVDKDLTYEYDDVLEYNDETSVNFTLPNYTNHFYLEIQGSQQVIKGYVKINSQVWEFHTPDWYYEGAYYLSDFE
ncbi:hypothetical protein [Kordia sp.]|uniref:hypothetical protein n=1 Tax=Kordia sp. TaxID=1965332 RepID=UPI003B5CCEA0